MDSKRLLTALAALLMAVCAFADKDAVKVKLLEARPGLPIESVKVSELPGFVQVNLRGGHKLYATSDGAYFVAGDLYRVESADFVNVSDQERSVHRKRVLDSLDESEMLVFAPPADKVKATVTVFTDIDCGFCRKLHQEVPAMNELGIAIRYLAYPRAGIESDSYNKIVSAWCASDPLNALTKAKQGEAIPTRKCSNPVAKQYELGGELNVTGTPTLLFEDGGMRGGYLPAKLVAAHLGLSTGTAAQKVVAN